MLVITKKDKRSPHDVVLGWTELLGWDDTIMLYSVRHHHTTTVRSGHAATNRQAELCNCIVYSVYTHTNTNTNKPFRVRVAAEGIHFILFEVYPFFCHVDYV